MTVIHRRYTEVVAAHPTAAEAGRALAERDIAEGRLRFIHLFPLHCYTPQDWAGEYHRLLRERFGVDPLAVVDNPYTDFDDSHVFECEHGWQMRAEIDRRFGEGAFEAVVAEAKRLYAMKSGSPPQ